MDNEGLGPAERIIQTVLAYSDHMVHNRPGVVSQDARSVTGVRWHFVTHKNEDAGKVVYRIDRVGKQNNRTRIGVMNGTNEIRENGRVIGRYQPAGVFPEVALWLYKQFVEIWKLDNEFCARFASHVYKQKHKDIKVVAAAFMMVQARKGDPIIDEGKVAFHDDDFREVGEAMCLLYDNKQYALTPKMLLQIRKVLELPEIAQINRDLGFARSARTSFLGRWRRVVTKWLRFREENAPLLKGLVDGAWTSTVRDLCRMVGYKPQAAQFCKLLRWKQKQTKDGRRALAIGEAVEAGTSWEGKSEEEICSIIERDKPNWKRIVRWVPADVGITRAVMACAIESGCMSKKDMVIQSPTIEMLGLLQVQSIKALWQDAVQSAEDMRAANIARNMKSKEGTEALEAGADKALQTEVEEVMDNWRVYVLVDVSSSMEKAIDEAKRILPKFLQGFPEDKLHTAVFNSAGREIRIPHRSAAGVRQAFIGISAGGGTDIAEGIRALQHHRPKDGEQALMIFVTDEGAEDFVEAIRRTGWDVPAFGLVRVVSPTWPSRRTAVQNTAHKLGIPCFRIDENTFDDPYAIPRTIRNLIDATPVTAAVATEAGMKHRVRLVDTILKTELLKNPTWAQGAGA